MDDLEGLRARLLSLTAVQQRAAEGVASGLSVTEAAEEAGVARETVSRWCSNHPAFRAAVADLRGRFVVESLRRAERVRSKALEALEAALDEGGSAAAYLALSVIKVIPPPQMGSLADAEALLREQLGRARPRVDLSGDLESLLERSDPDAEALRRVAEAAGVD